jgi:large subunit ribosomal protein L18
MANKKYGKKRTVQHRRKRATRTNYKKRLALLKSGKPRLVIRKTTNTIIAQIVQYEPEGDRVLVTATSTELRKLGWKAHTGNMPSAYLTGLLVAKKAQNVKVKEAILDLGLTTPAVGGKIYAVLKGAVEGGLKIPHSDDPLPADERVQGKHIADYATAIRQDERYQRQFSGYIKSGQQPENIQKNMEEIKQKIKAQ